MAEREREREREREGGGSVLLARFNDDSDDVSSVKIKYH